MVKSVGEDGLMDYNRSRKRSKSVNSSRSWKVMHEYFDAVDKCEEDDSRIRELEEEIQLLRARKNHNNCQRQILLDKVMGIDEIRVLDMADVDCLDKLCKLGFRGRILVEEELRLLQSAMDKIPLPYEICRDKKVDRISSLPDELLALILSSLPFKEAVATSTLSSRWRYLWTFITKLHFDGTSSMVKMAFGDRRLVVGYESRFDKARLNYVEWVNHVIALHKSPNLEEFRVFFDLTESYRNLIDEWLRFALTKKVQSLELNLTAYLFFRHPLSNDNYTFDPYNLFSGSIDHVKYLKKIFLCWVNVSGEALAFLLCNCPLLEDLSLSKSNGLSTLKIVGPFPSFKRLEINSCYRLRSVEIHDVNLVYFKFVGSRPGHFVVKNLPLLVEMYIEGSIWDVGDVLWRFSKCLPQLEILTLDISSGLTLNIPFPLSDHSIILGSAVKMRNLKQLIIVTTMKDNGKPLMILITNLLRVLPSLQLQRFVLEATHPEFIEMETRNARTLIIVEKTTKRSYPQLKEIEFVGYRGAQCELELLVHFLDNAVALEKVVVDTRKPIKRLEEKPYFATHKNKVNEVEVSARSRARKELSVIVPQKINLKIL